MGAVLKARPAAVLAVVVCGCGGGGRQIAGAGEDPDPSLYEVLLTTSAVSCRPYEEYQTMTTPEGAEVSGIEVCAEFTGACDCGSHEETRDALARVSGDGTCFTWQLVSSSFWAYETGGVCRSGGGWELSLEPYPGGVCGLSIEPQIRDGVLFAMEVLCRWTTDDGTTRVTDRILVQRRHSKP
jgi:hypothetical protein